MGRTFIAGLAVLGIAAITLLIDGAFGLGMGNVLYGIAVGAVLGLVKDGSPLGRVGAFVVGILLTFVGYALRVLVLNSSTLGLFVYMLIILVITAGICALTKNRMPLWAGLLGIAAVIGSYEAYYLQAPQNLLAELPAQLSTLLLPAALAFIVTVLLPSGPPPPSQNDGDEINTWSQPVSTTKNTEVI